MQTFSRRLRFAGPNSSLTSEKDSLDVVWYNVPTFRKVNQSIPSHKRYLRGGGVDVVVTVAVLVTVQGMW